MVTSTREGPRLTIVARPDCSADWRTNLLVLSALAVPSLGGGVLLALAGAWPVLPLAGLEMLTLGAALYTVQRKLQYRQVITLDPDTVDIAQGFSTPRESWRFRRTAAGLTVATAPHPWQGPALAVHERGQRVALGEFLARDDQLRLCELLRSEIRVRDQGPRASAVF